MLIMIVQWLLIHLDHMRMILSSLIRLIIRNIASAEKRREKGRDRRRDQAAQTQQPATSTLLLRRRPATLISMAAALAEQRLT
jgi:hypothetical protein